MHIIFGSNNRWAQKELLRWLGIDSLDEAHSIDNGIDLHYRNPEQCDGYNDKQTHRELIEQLGEDAAVHIVMMACHKKSDAIVRQLTTDTTDIQWQQLLQQQQQQEQEQQSGEVALLVCNDLVVRFEGRVRNSPDTPEQARSYLKSYCGKSLECVAGVSITNLKTMRRLEGVSITRVYLKEHIPDDVLDRIVSKPQVLRAAGGFVPDDPLLQPYVSHIEGSLDTVMGLPKDLTLRLLAEHQYMESEQHLQLQQQQEEEDLDSSMAMGPDGDDVNIMPPPPQQQQQQQPSATLATCFTPVDYSSTVSSFGFSADIEGSFGAHFGGDSMLDTTDASRSNDSTLSNEIILA